MKYEKRPRLDNRSVVVRVGSKREIYIYRPDLQDDSDAVVELVGADAKDNEGAVLMSVNILYFSNEIKICHI